MTASVRKSPARSVLVLAVLAIAAGIAVGFIGGTFRWLLVQAETLRDGVASWAHDVPFGWAITIAFVAVGALVGAILVRMSPRSAGSGIQDVEAVFHHEMPLPPLSVVPGRFIGGLASIGSGMVLGREGPTVHLAAALGVGAGRAARLDDDDLTVMQTAMSGAGLAVAFNAPVGGAVFVLEEVARSANYRLIVPTVLGVASAIVCSRAVIGDQPDFAVQDIAGPPLFTLPLFLVFGVVIGLAGALYNSLIVALFRASRRLTRVPVLVRATVIGALIGLALYVDPLAVGGGDALTQMLLAGHAFALPVLLMYIVMRFVAGPLSYAAATPGGLFAPLLALGALFGTAFGHLAQLFVPGLGTQFVVAMAIVGMSTMFASAVRAPLTGIALIIEMTAITTVTVPMLLAGGAAVVTAMLVKSPPIYDSLRAIMLGRESAKE